MANAENQMHARDTEDEGSATAVGGSAVDALAHALLVLAPVSG